MRGSRSVDRRRVDLEGLEVAGVDAHEGRREGEGPVELGGVVDLDERGHAELARLVVEVAHQRVVERRDDEQDEVGAVGAGLSHLVGVDHEVLAQHGDPHGGAHGVEVGEAAVKPALLGEDADDARAPSGIRRGETTGLGDLREGALARARALDLGDDADAAGVTQRRDGVEGGRDVGDPRLEVGERHGRPATVEVLADPADDPVEDARHRAQLLPMVGLPDSSGASARAPPACAWWPASP